MSDEIRLLVEVLGGFSADNFRTGAYRARIAHGDLLVYVTKTNGRFWVVGDGISARPLSAVRVDFPSFELVERLATVGPCKECEGAGVVDKVVRSEQFDGNGEIAFRKDMATLIEHREPHGLIVVVGETAADRWLEFIERRQCRSCSGSGNDREEVKI